MKKIKAKIIESSNETVKIGDKFKTEISTKNGNGCTSGRRGRGGNKKSKQPSFKDVVLQFIVKQEAFNNEVVSFVKEQKQFNSEQKEFNSAVITTLKEHGEAIAQLNIKVDKIDDKVEKIEDRVENVIKLNNLKH
ncbi:MAG: hypothetical protein LBB45_03760 [Methanobrevibacter sp.]|jgi:GTP-binding protein EngB required for normal cell division|nr:hypothetical protein [Candidatus Methanovirga basalitermitum]